MNFKGAIAKNQEIKKELKEEKEVHLRATKSEVEKAERALAEHNRKKRVADNNFKELMDQKYYLYDL